MTLTFTLNFNDAFNKLNTQQNAKLIIIQIILKLKIPNQRIKEKNNINKNKFFFLMKNAHILQ